MTQKELDLSAALEKANLTIDWLKAEIKLVAANYEIAKTMVDEMRGVR